MEQEVQLDIFSTDFSQLLTHFSISVQCQLVFTRFGAWKAGLATAEAGNHPPPLTIVCS